jgi:hypothetical protein
MKEGRALWGRREEGGRIQQAMGGLQEDECMRLRGGLVWPQGGECGSEAGWLSE